MNNFLMLRGAVPEDRSPIEIMHDSLKTEDDMWIHLFNELIGKNNHGEVWYIDRKEYKLFYEKKYRNNLLIKFISNRLLSLLPTDYTINDWNVIFARGGFSYYLPILERASNAYKIRYGAGKRFMPEPDIDYQLILVDTEKQKAEVLAKYPKANVHLFIKPAARHFKPVEAYKEYDVCYIANGAQARFKGVEWVYDTAPKDLKILHLGYPSKFTPPSNITCKRVDRIDMPKEISRCKIGIVPYDSIDSCPRVIPEMLACGLPLVILDTVNFWEEKYTQCDIKTKNEFWEHTKGIIECYLNTFDESTIANDYKYNLALPIAAQYLKDLIKCDYWVNILNFFFVQIGACDGVFVDPIHRFIIKHRWRGVLVEPVPYLFNLLMQNYEGYNLIFENVAISDKEEIKPLYYVDPDHSVNYKEDYPCTNFLEGKGYKVTNYHNNALAELK